MFQSISTSWYLSSRRCAKQSQRLGRAVVSDQSEPLRRAFSWRGVSLLLFCLAALGILPSVKFHFGANLSLQSTLCAMLAFVCMFSNFVVSLIYLARRNPQADAFASASAQLAVISSGAALVLGIASTHRQLSVWWVWDAGGMVSFFALTIYAGYLMLRKLCDPGRAQLIASVFAIFAFIGIPFIYVAVQLRLSEPATLGRMFAPDIFGILCRPPQLWNALSSLALAALTVAAEYRLLSIQQRIEERLWARHSSGSETE